MHGATDGYPAINMRTHGSTDGNPSEDEWEKYARTMKEVADRGREAKSKVNAESMEKEIVAEEPEEIVAEELEDG